YAQAYAGLASVAAVIKDYLPVNPDSVDARATWAAHKALHLDTALAEAHAVLGLLKRNTRLSESLHDLKYAIELDRENGNTHYWYALSLITAGRVDSAVSELRQAHELDPVAANLANGYAAILGGLGRYAESESLVKGIIRENPTYPVSYPNLVGV